MGSPNRPPTLVTWSDPPTGIEPSWAGERRVVGSLAELRAALRIDAPAVVLVALSPADREILPALARLRRTAESLRIVAVTPPDAWELRLEALETGLDDALPAGMPPGELDGRLRLAARGLGDPDVHLVVAPGLELDTDARALRRDGHLIRLRPMEYRLLLELARHPRRPLERRRLARRIGSTSAAGTTRTIDVHVRWLREKIEPDPHNPVHLVTVRGVGYQLEPEPGAPHDAGEQNVNGSVTAR